MRSTVAAGLAFLACLTGCSQLASLLDSIDKPTASISGVSLEDLSLEAVTLNFDVDVDNPYSVPLPLVDLAYDVGSGDASLLQGNADLQQEAAIPAKSKKTLSLPATLKFKDVVKVLTSFKPGQVFPYKANLGLGLDAPAVGRMSLPLSHEGKLPIPTVPKVALKDVRVDQLSFSDAKVVLDLDVTNTNEFPVDLSKLEYGLNLGGSKVAKSALEGATKFEPGQTNNIQIPLSLSLKDLGLGVFNMLSGSKGSKYELAGNFDVNTPFGPLRMPYSSAGDTKVSR